jgi:hypothetical protein
MADRHANDQREPLDRVRPGRAMLRQVWVGSFRISAAALVVFCALALILIGIVIWRALIFN